MAEYQVALQSCWLLVVVVVVVVVVVYKFQVARAVGFLG
jgi:hypothetical protein